MPNVVVIGKTLEDARAYSEHYGLNAQVISPQSFHARFNGLLVDQFYVTRAAFKHPNIIRTVMTVQTYMRHQGD
jgi:tRNA-dihydrouridine synthase